MKNNKRKVDKKIVAQPQSKEIIREKLSHHIFSISLILIISISIYSNTLKNGFVYDDEFTIVNNTLIKNFGNLPKLLPPLNPLLVKEGKGVVDYFTASGEMSYRPVVTFTYFIDYAIYGLKPWGYHLTNVLLHAMNGVLLYIFIVLLITPVIPIPSHVIPNEVRNLKISPFSRNDNSLLSLSISNKPLLISLIFVTHPVLTEAVNAISFREDLLCFFFYMSTLTIYLLLKTKSNVTLNLFQGQGSNMRVNLLYALSYFFYLLALLSKEMAITFPLIIFLYEWIYGKQPLQSPFVKGELKGFRGLLFNPYIIGYIAITCFYLYLRFFLFHNPVEENISAWSFSERLITIPYLISKYLLLLIAPVSLSADYVITPIKSIFSLLFLVSMFVIILLFFITYKLAPLPTGERVGVRGILFSILFFLLTLLPVYNAIPIANPFAERYLYLPMLGFAIIIGSTLTWLIAHIPFKNITGQGLWRITHQSSLIAQCLLLIIISLFSFAVIQRNKIWANHYSLWSDTVRKMPESSKAHYNLGNASREQGQLDEAIKELKLALSLKPDYAKAHNIIGLVYEKKGQIDEAIKEYRMAISLKPDLHEAHNNLGDIYENQGQIDEAIREYKMAIKINPYLTEAYNNLGNVYAKQGKLDEAIKEYLIALRLNPDYANAYYNLGNIYHKQGRLEDATKEYLAAIGLKPEFAIAYRNLGLTYIKQQKIDEAINEFLTALKFNPNDPITHYNMALAYNLKGLNDRAIEEYQIALRLKPDYTKAQDSLRKVLKTEK